MQFAAGAIGGALFTPMPWKLAEDTAVWSQNWAWRPSPKSGEITSVATTCQLCGGGCGITARLVDRQRAIMLQGNPNHSINNGGICPLGASGVQFLYAPYRIPQPLKQTGKRGDPTGLKPISWDEALSALDAKLTELRTSGNPHRVAAITGQSENSMHRLWQQFLTAYGSPNLFTMPSPADSQKLAASLVFGRQAPLGFALEQANYVLSFGAHLIEGWGAPGRMQVTYGRWRDEKPGSAKTRIVQIEPRCSVTAANADEWIAINPGTEAAMALGIAHVLIRDLLYDADFVSNHAFGYEDWQDAAGKTRQGFKSFVLANYPPEKVSELTGVASEKIKELATEFARQKRAVAVWGSGNGTGPNNLYDDLVFLALNALTGNLGKSAMLGLTPEVPLGALPAPTMDGIAQRGLAQQRLDLAPKPNWPLPGNGVHAFLEAISANPAYPVEVLLIHEANPAYTLPGNQIYYSAQEKIGLVVSFSSYLDETALLADLILPNHSALERLDDVCGLPGVPYAYYAIASPILPPQRDTRHTGEVLLGTAQGIGGSVAASLPWKKYDDYLQERVQGLAASGQGAIAEYREIEPWRLQPGDSPELFYRRPPTEGNSTEQKTPESLQKTRTVQAYWKKLTGGMFWYDAPVNVLKNLATPSGRYEFALQNLQGKGTAADEDRLYLPHYHPLAPSGDEKDYPLLLISYRMLSLSDQFLANPPFMTKTLSDDLLQGQDLFLALHPQTARAQGFSAGDRAQLKTPQGEVAVRIHVSQGARPGALFIVQGLGHTAYDEYIQNKGVNANEIIEVQMDPLTGLATTWATRAQLRRA